MKTQIKNIGIIATISLVIFAVGQSVFAYSSIDGYVAQVEKDILTFQNSTANSNEEGVSAEDQYKIDIVRKAMDGAR